MRKLGSDGLFFLLLNVCLLTFVHTLFGKTVLLHNASGIIPFQGLSSSSMHVAALGIRSPKKVFDRVSFHKQVDNQANSINDLEQLEFHPGDRCLLFLTTNDIEDRLQAWLSQNHHLQVIICFVDRPPVNLPHIAATIYHSTQESGDLLEVVDAIFGSIAFEDTLDRDLGAYALGSGISTIGGVRLAHLNQLAGYQYRSLEDTMDVIMEAAMEGQAFPGAQLLIVHDNQVVIDKVYGHHTYEAKRAVQHDDLFDLASITKVSSAVPALMYLLDQKMIDLDVPLCKYFPVFCKADKKSITLRQALAHYGRLLPYIVYWQQAIKKNGKYKARSFRVSESEKYATKITDSLFLHNKYKRKIDRAIKKSALNPDPGYVYSGLTFLLYPDLVREKLDIPIDSFLYQYLYWPLGAESLTYRPMDRFSVDRIVPTELDTIFRKQLVHGMVHDEAAAMLDGVSCNAGLFSNARDLAKLCAMYLNDGEYGGKRYLSSDVVRQFTSCQYCDEGNRRGLGFDKPMLEYNARYSYVAESASSESFGHSGFTGTFFWIDPTNETILILLSNRVYPTRDQRNLYALGIRPRLHQAVYDFLEFRAGSN